MISVVIPLYNKARHIGRALDSVLSQTYQEFEVIVVNDGSADGSEKTVEPYVGPRIRLVNQQHSGVAAARNRGVDEATSDLIAFLDADDEWRPEHLATIHRLAERYPQCGAYSTAFEIVTDGNRRKQPSFVDVPCLPYEGIMASYFHTAFDCQIVSSSSTAVPRRPFDICGRFRVGVKNGADMDLWCRIALKYRMAFSTYIGAVVHQDVRVRTGRNRRVLGEFEAIATVNNALAEGELPEGVTRNDLVEYLNKRLLVRASRNVLNGHAREARTLLRRAAGTRVYRGMVRRWVLLSYVPASLVNLALSARVLIKFGRSRKSAEDQDTRRRNQNLFGDGPVNAGSRPGIFLRWQRRLGRYPRRPVHTELLPTERTRSHRGAVADTPIAEAVLVSVVTPLYNKVRHIGRALDSVLAQTHDDFEVVVVNDGSTDGSEKIVESYSDPRIRLINQENAGISAARNRGIAEARADLIAFLDADDEWLPEHLETILRLRGKFPQCGAYATAFRIVTRRGEKTPPFTGVPAPPYEGVIPNYFRTVYGDHAVWTSAVAVPREIFNNCGLFPVGERRREDLDMWCRIALKYPIAFSTSAGAVYHQEADNRVGNGPPELTEPRVVRTLEGAMAAGTLPGGVTRTDLLEYASIQLITRAIRILMYGSPEQARRLLLKASATRTQRGVLRRWMLLSSLPGPVIRLALGVRRFPVFLRSNAIGRKMPS